MIQYAITGNEDGEKNIVVFVSGQAPLVAHDTHPNFEKIVYGAITGDPRVIDLFDIARTAEQKFRRLSERVTAKNGRLYLDGVEVDNALSAQVIRFIEQGVNDWQPLVLFFENVQANPNEHSREQLYKWLAAEAFTINQDGMIVGYKGVKPTRDGTGYESIHSGRATVNGVEHTGHIPNNIGDIVEMPRDKVAHDPSVGCHTGLHVGTYGYANSFAQGALLEVIVNPRDVVSVPTDCSAQKMRTCRYTVVGTIDAPHTAPIVASGGDWTDADTWGDGEYDDYPEDAYCLGCDPGDCTGC